MLTFAILLGQSLLLALINSQSAMPSLGCQPFGVRLSYGQYYTINGQPNDPQLYVTFNTFDYCPGSYVGFGNLDVYNQYPCTTANLSFTWATPPVFNNTIYTCPISNLSLLPINPFIYTAIGLSPNGTLIPFLNKNISIVLYNKNISSSVPLNFVVLGDWNYFSPVNNPPYPSVTNCLNVLEQLLETSIQGVIFLGDQAYDLDSNNGTNYLEFLLMIQPYSSIWPFMGTPGNHEWKTQGDVLVYNLSYPYPYANNYMFFYNFVLGSATFVSFDPTASIYNYSDASANMINTTNLLNFTIQQTTTPFVIPFSHYPFYCSLANISQCQTDNQTLYPLEQVMIENQIPLYLSAHIHTYQREYPLNLQGQIVSSSPNLINPQAPVSIVEGAAGNTANVVTTPYNLQYFTAASVTGTGFGILSIMSADSLVYTHFNASICAASDQITILIGPNHNQRHSILPGWAIGLICVGGVLLIALIVYLIVRRVKKTRQQDHRDRYSQMQVLQSSIIT